MSDYEKWLNGEISDSDLSHRQYGAFQERSRIIKLLETWCCGTDNCGFDKVLRNTTECEQAQDAIALIKGEK